MDGPSGAVSTPEARSTTADVQRGVHTPNVSTRRMMHDYVNTVSYDLQVVTAVIAAASLSAAFPAMHARGTSRTF